MKLEEQKIQSQKRTRRKKKAIKGMMIKTETQIDQRTPICFLY
jgi:hypothetical protein